MSNALNELKQLPFPMSIEIYLEQVICHDVKDFGGKKCAFYQVGNKSILKQKQMQLKKIINVLFFLIKIGILILLIKFLGNFFG